MTDLDALAERLTELAEVLEAQEMATAYAMSRPADYSGYAFIRAAADTLLALRQEMADEDAGYALALKAANGQRDTARGDFERAELARARAEVARDAAEALAAHLPERWYSCETMDAVRKERDAALRELADANASIAHAAEAYSAAIRERNIAQADTARLDKAEALLAAGGDILSADDDHDVTITRRDSDTVAGGPTLRVALDACPGLGET